jgi:hypothetical protein
MSPRRSARIANKNKQNENVEQPVLTPERKIKSKKSGKNTKNASPEKVCEEETTEVTITPVESLTEPIDKGKGKSKEIIQHSDGSTSILEPIDSLWLQERELARKHDDSNDNLDIQTLGEFPENSEQLKDMNEEDYDSDDWEEVDLSACQG